VASDGERLSGRLIDERLRKAEAATDDEWAADRRRDGRRMMSRRLTAGGGWSAAGWASDDKWRLIGGGCSG